MNKDTILGIGTAILSSVMIWQANLLPRGNKWDLLGPASYPRYISWSLFTLSVLLILLSLRRGNNKEKWDWTSYVLPGITFVILIIYVAIMPHMGFIISTLLFLFTLQYVLSSVEKKPTLRILIITLLFTYGIYFVASYLNVQLPILSI